MQNDGVLQTSCFLILNDCMTYFWKLACELFGEKCNSYYRRDELSSVWFNKRPWNNGSHLETREQNPSGFLFQTVPSQIIFLVLTNILYLWRKYVLLV